MEPSDTATLSNEVAAPLPTPSTRPLQENDPDHLGSEKPLSVSVLFTSHINTDFETERCGAGDVEVLSMGSGRPSRLEDQCGIPTKAGVNVVYRVSGGDPPRARTWYLGDVSEAPERIPIIKNPYSNRYRPQVPSQDDSSM